MQRQVPLIYFVAVGCRCIPGDPPGIRDVREPGPAVAELDTDSRQELRLFARWSDLVDAGEAEAIAVALSRGWVVGLEDLFAQRHLTAEAGTANWVNTATLIIAAVRQGRKSMAEADALFVRLDYYSGYRKRGITSLESLSLS